MMLQSRSIGSRWRRVSRVVVITVWSVMGLAALLVMTLLNFVG
jgi:hypothetical protein